MKHCRFIALLIACTLALIGCGGNPAGTTAASTRKTDPASSGAADSTNPTVSSDPTVPGTNPTTAPWSDPTKPGTDPTTFADALYAVFTSNDVSLRPRPLFFWNTSLAKMDETELRTIIRRCYEECGYGGFGILPYWMDGYLTDRYFDLYEAALDEGSKYGMQFSLYDENGFPSYVAGGYLAEKYPNLTAKRLDKVEVSGKGGQTLLLSIPDGTFMGAVLMNTATFERIDISDKAVIKEKGDKNDYAPGYYSSSDFSADYVAKFAFDNNASTRWNAADGTSGDQWLMEVFDKEVTIDSVTISEAFDRIRSFDIQYWNGSDWVTCSSGTTVGANKQISFDPVKTTRIRLYVNTISSDSVSIWEFAAYNGNNKLTVDTSASVKDGSYIEYKVPSGNWKMMAFVCVKDGTKGMDYLSADSVRAYIDITYEAYYARFEKYFGTTITTAFYDEPCFWPSNQNYGVEGARFWTPAFNETFAKIYGDDVNPILYYPALFEDIGADTTEARDRLEYVRTTLFAENYIGQIDEWCKQHSIQLTGHMNEEQSKNPVGLHGDLMRVFQHQAIPGIDVIWNYGQSQTAYKIVSSSAYNWGKQLVMVEAFGDISGANINTLYKITMDLYAKGINLMVPHAVWYDMNNVVFNPELSYRNTLFSKRLEAFSQYVTRLNAILQKGDHVADIAVLYPIDYLESQFLFNGSYNEPADANYMEVGEELSLNSRHDFTYLHPDVLDGNCTVKNGILSLGGQNYENYKTVIITGSKVISLSNLQKIYEFWQSGGSVIAVGTLPTKGITAGEDAEVVRLISEMFGVDPTKALPATNTVESSACSKAIYIKNVSSLDDALNLANDSYDVRIDITDGTVKNGNYTYIHKVVDGRNVWFVANSSASTITSTITLDGEYSALEFWDPATGNLTAAEVTVENGKTTVSLSLKAVSSMFIVEPQK